jgi:hypothetical protein
VAVRPYAPFWDTAERLGADSPALTQQTMTLDALVARASTGTVDIGRDAPPRRRVGASKRSFKSSWAGRDYLLSLVVMRPMVGSRSDTASPQRRVIVLEFASLRVVCGKVYGTVSR